MLILLFSSLVFGVRFKNIAEAGATDKVGGWAWNGLYGWTGFNSKDLDLNSDTFIDNDFDGASNDGDDISVINHGVDIDNDSLTSDGDYRFYGQAYNSGLGWIYFEKIKTCNNNRSKTCSVDGDCGVGNTCDYLEPDDQGYLAHCKKYNNGVATLTTFPSNDSHKVLACYDIETGKVYGWAYILSLGENGWIRLDDDNNAALPAYGVSVDWATGGVPELKGWAYNQGANGTGMGWLSFNSKDLDADNNSYIDAAFGGDNSNTVNNAYQVKADINLAPTVTNLSVTAPDACAAGSVLAGYKLNFTYKDDSLDANMAGKAVTAKQFTVNIENAGTSVYTKTCDNSSNYCEVDQNCLKNQFVNGAQTPVCTVNVPVDKINDYSTNHTYTIEVTDSNGGTKSATGNFTTAAAELPDAAILLSKANPSIGEQVVLTSDSFYYPSGTRTECGNNCTYAWTFDVAAENTDYKIDSGAVTGSQITITVLTDKLKTTGSINLAVTASGNSCTDETNFTDIKPPLPTWVETGADE